MEIIKTEPCICDSKVRLYNGPFLVQTQVKWTTPLECYGKGNTVIELVSFERVLL